MYLRHRLACEIIKTENALQQNVEIPGNCIFRAPIVGSHDRTYQLHYEKETGFYFVVTRDIFSSFGFSGADTYSLKNHRDSLVCELLIQSVFDILDLLRDFDNNLTALIADLRVRLTPDKNLTLQYVFANYRDQVQRGSYVSENCQVYDDLNDLIHDVKNYSPMGYIFLIALNEVNSRVQNYVVLAKV